MSAPFQSAYSKERFRAPWLVFWVAFAVRVIYLTLAHTYRIRGYDDHMLFGDGLGGTAVSPAARRSIQSVRRFHAPVGVGDSHHR